jgi:hypothetical protein
VVDLVSPSEKVLPRNVDSDVGLPPEKIEQPRPHTDGNSPSILKRIRSTFGNIGSSLYEQQHFLLGYTCSNNTQI